MAQKFPRLGVFELFFPEAVSYEEIFPRNFGVGGVKKFLGKKKQVHNLKISDRLLGSKTFFQENIPSFMSSVFRNARGGGGVGWEDADGRVSDG